MRTAVITGWTGDLFAKIACHTVPLIEAYAHRHGALFGCANLSGNRPPSWNKVHHLLDALAQVDRVAWIDSDVVIERPQTNILAELSDSHWQGLVPHHTDSGIIPNCGVWLLTKQMIPVLHEIWNSGLYLDHPWWEQACMLEKMGFNVEHPRATLEQPTALYDKTTWLNPTWNHHPDDQLKVASPHFRHITRYPERLEATIFYAAKAQATSPIESNSPALSEALFTKNLRCLLPPCELRQDALTAHNSPSGRPLHNFRGNQVSVFTWGRPTCDLHAIDSELKALAASVEKLPVTKVGIFGAGQLLPYLKFSGKELVVLEPDPTVVALCFSRLDFGERKIIFSSTVQEFLSAKPAALVVYEPTRKQYASEFREIEAYFSAPKNQTVKRAIRAQKSSQLRILVQARSDIYQSLGGDTVAMERSTEALRKLGVSAVIDPDGREDPRNYDVVHLYNFATPEQIEPHGRRAKELNVPFVVTTLYEDLKEFSVKMCLYGHVMTKHLAGEYRDSPFELIQEGIRSAVPQFTSAPIVRDNEFLALHASALLSSGETESALLHRDYPFARAIQVIPFGCHASLDVGPELFYNKFQIRDYILCVGRIEWRKNQAMLLKAFEHSDLPIVLVAGNMTYQPEYQDAVVKFQRKGKTLVVANLTLEELLSAYRGALVHVLPSWFELPGLVSLEAAKLGTPVVGTSRGTLYDYLGDNALYCNPESLESIEAAVAAAIGRPRGREALIEKAEQFTWRRTAENLVDLYTSVMDGSLHRAESSFEGSTDSDNFYPAVA